MPSTETQQSFNLVLQTSNSDKNEELKKKDKIMVQFAGKKSERWSRCCRRSISVGRAQDKQFEAERWRPGRPEQSDHQSAVITRRRGRVNAEE